MPRTHSVEKGQQILQGALPEFLKYGYDRTSMDKVATAAGVSKQTLYSHFSDKDGLFTALVKKMACEKFQLVWSKPLKGEPEKVLRDLARRLLKVVNDAEHLCFVRLIVAESGKRPDLSKLFLSNVAQPAMVILTRYFNDHEELKFADSEATARIFVGTLIHFILTQEVLHGKDIMPMEAERLIDNLVHLIVGN
ncbi:MAG: TetR/AcrR family transcriptional regulator [Moorea sp. SIO2B7]|nr:TetR/AcrR family transcriptional regulator [Moorena sp. SIO2B7]